MSFAKVLDIVNGRIAFVVVAKKYQVASLTLIWLLKITTSSF
jgi:hypothetical protein